MSKLAIIGLGKMGTSLLEGIIESGSYSADKIIVSDIKLDNDKLEGKYQGIKMTTDNKEAVKGVDVVLLAVKPQVMAAVLDNIKYSLANKLLITIAAGLSLASYQKTVPDSCRIIRVMPNTPSLVKEGISAFTASENASKEDLKQVKSLLKGVGEVVEVKEELMDAVTGLSGSGPAYIYMVIEALADGGVLMGLPRELSQKLAAQTVLGAARMVMETGQHPGELKDMVTSPGGTTIRAVEVLEEKGLRGSMIQAVKAAAERSKELNN